MQSGTWTKVDGCVGIADRGGVCFTDNETRFNAALGQFGYSFLADIRDHVTSERLRGNGKHIERMLFTHMRISEVLAVAAV